MATCLVVAASMFGSLSACSGRPTSFPDRDGVVAAQSDWCAALAKLQRAGSSWEHLASCKAAYPTSSPEYLRGMTKCFTRRMEVAGDDAPDRSLVITECNEEVAAALKADDPAVKPVIDARCSRMNRCENIAVATCKSGFSKLEAAQRVMFTSAFNALGRYEITDCLESASCTDDEDAGREACYKPVAQELLWFPK